jgi:hypothetical protein
MLGSVLLIDDGELSSALDELQQLDVVIDHVPGDPNPEDLEPPYELVVSSVRRAPALSSALEAAGAGTKPPWIAIHHQDFLPLRDRLRRAGVDYLVVDGVSPQALRLLFLHALYRGPEKRRAPRLPIGAEVKWSSGEKNGTACLIDLTAQGCRVSGPEGIEAGDRLILSFPSGITAGRELRLEGRVTRADFGPAPEAPRLAVGFQKLDARSRQALEAILRGNAIGTRVTPLTSEAAHSAPASARTDTPFPELDQPAPSDESDEDALLLDQEDRRERPRARYGRPVTAESRGASFVLLGHDLSPDGMRIQADPHLRVGSLLRLTLFGGPGQRPAVIPARVIHDEGERGMLIGFGQMPKEAREALDSILEAAPAIQVLTESDEDSGPVVVSESIFD